MRTGLTDYLEDIQDFRKTAVIDFELKRLNVDIVALQETRLPETGSLKEENYTFFWHGKGLDETHEHGSRVCCQEHSSYVSEGSERILKMQQSTTSGLINLFSVYAPTLLATNERSIL